MSTQATTDEQATFEHYRDALLVLLGPHTEGLTEADVAVGLKLHPEQVTPLLTQAEVGGFIAVDFDSETGLTRYRSAGALVPALTLENALSNAERETRALARKRKDAEQSRRQRKSRVLMALLGLILIGGIATLVVSFAADDGEAPPTTGVEATVNAKLAKKRHQKVLSDLKKIKARIEKLEAAKRAGNCAEVWKTKDECYVGGRMMSSGQFRKDKAQMEMKQGELEDLKRLYESKAP